MEAIGTSICNIRGAASIGYSGGGMDPGVIEFGSRVLCYKNVLRRN